MLVVPLAQRQSVLVDADIYQEKVTWEHPRDLDADAEMDGNASYGIGTNLTTLGLYELMASETLIDTIRLNARCTNAARQLALRVYFRDTYYGFDFGATTPDFVGTLPAGTFPTGTQAAVNISLKDIATSAYQQLVCPAGKYLFVLLTTTVAGELGFPMWTGDASAAPLRHGMKSSSDGHAMSETSVGAGYAATTFKLSASVNLTHNIASAWTHPRGDAELLGDVAWAVNSSAPGVAFREQMTGVTHFDRVRIATYFAYASQTVAQAVDMYVYVRNDSSNFIPNNVTAAAHVHYAKGEFPADAGIHTFVLPETVSALAGQWVWIVFFSPNAESGITLMEFNVFDAAGSSPTRSGYIIFTAMTSQTVVVTGSYYSTSFQLLDTIPIPVDLATIVNNFPSDAVKFDAGLTGMASTDVNAAIKEAYNRSASGILPRIVLPDEFVAVVGDTLQLFKRGLIETWDVYGTPHELLCDFGNSFPRFYETTPTAAGNHTLAVNVLDINGSVLQTASVSVKVVNPTGAPATAKNVLCVGDSLTEGGEWATEMYRRLSQSGGTPAGLGYGTKIAMQGDKLMPAYNSPQQYYMGTGGARWEDYLNQGISFAYNVTAAGHGKTSADLWTDYVDSASNNWKLTRINGDVLKFIPDGHSSAMPAAPASLTRSGHSTINYTAIASTPWTPFWDSTHNALSFSAFSTGYFSGVTPDIVYVLLGWNEDSVKNPDHANASDHTVAVGMATTFINQLHADWPAAQVRLFGVQIPSMHGWNDLSGANGGSTGAATRANWYRMLRSVNGLNLAYQALAKTGVAANADSYSTFVKFLNLSCQFDAEYNAQETDAYVNTRNSTVTEKHGTNTVHPAGTGYLQIADVAYRDFVRTFCSS